MAEQSGRARKDRCQYSFSRPWDLDEPHIRLHCAVRCARARAPSGLRVQAEWIPEIEAMIVDHHKISALRVKSGVAGRTVSARRLDRRVVTEHSAYRVRSSRRVPQCGRVPGFIGACFGFDSRSVPEASTNPATDGETLTRPSLARPRSWRQATRSSARFGRIDSANAAFSTTNEQDPLIRRRSTQM